MQVTTCDRCHVGWDKTTQTCKVPTGAEHLPDEPDIPTCPIQDRCQHQIQRTGPCDVRRKGLVCESALIFSGLSPDEAADHPLGFNAITVASPEEIEERGFISDGASS